MIREYRNGDVLKVLVQKAQEDEFVEAAAGFDQVGAYTLVDGVGDVLAVFGYAVDGRGAADGYALISRRAGRYLLEPVRFGRMEIPRLMRRLKLVRFQITVKAGFAAGERFARLLGFEAAEILPRFYKENDYQLFERIEK